MSHVLLLSPDDQVVNAITAVLAELSLTCDRPLDGGSAAQKLNSHSFDLVLVDCENLPAAKLIFDVCRRGKDGHSPVPIAIVDGRAGLPTAFRLGAELILTKPVSKDQARTTIRAAASRVKKDVPAAETVSASNLHHSATGSPNSADSEDWSKGASEAASPQLTSYSDPAPSFTPAKAAAAGAVNASAAVEAPHPSPVVAAADQQLPVASAPPTPKPLIPFTPSDDPVLAELERTELEATEKPAAAQETTSAEAPAATQHKSTHSDAPVFSSYQHQKKSSGAFVALMALVIAAGGLYGAWMCAPGFRALLQPQIDRIVALAGTAPQTQSVQMQKPTAQPAPTPAPASVASATPAAEQNKASESASETPADASGTSSSTAPFISPSVTPQSVAPQAAAPQPAPQTASVEPAASQPAPAISPAVTKPVVSKVGLSKTQASKPVETKKSQATAPLDTPLPGENSAIILSSKGAEKRLAHSVQPKYPSGARSDGAEETVVLKEMVDEDGKVTGVRLVEGNPTLATAAMQAVKQWRYRPYVRDGRAQPFQTVVIVDFQKP